jgi:hypothetical protein
MSTEVIEHVFSFQPYKLLAFCCISTEIIMPTEILVVARFNSHLDADARYDNGNGTA